MLRAALVGVPVGTWAALTEGGIWNPLTLSSPRLLGTLLWDWFTGGFIYPHIAQTLTEVAIGFVIGATAGIVMALVLARSDTLYAIFSPAVVMGNSIPRVILAPIFVMWLGFGTSSKVGVVAAMVFFPNFFNVYRGLTSVAEDFLNRTRTLGANTIDMVRHVYLPSAVVWLLASLKASVGFAFLAAVVAEFVGASKGVGFVIAQSAHTGSVTTIFGGILVIMAMVLPFTYAVSLLDRRLERWRPPLQ